MAKKPKQKNSTSGRRKVATEKKQNKREQTLIESSARSWPGKFWSLIRTISCLKSIYEWVDENPFM